jgi:CheY-like chemotaxis protein
MSSTILLIDDDHDTLKLLQLVLSTSGFQVVWAKNGREAIEQLAGNDLPVLIFCDILMPGLDGYDTLAAIRSDPRTHDIPVLMLSAIDQQKDVQRALRAGADGYIAKPFALRELLRQVKYYTSDRSPATLPHTAV